MLFHIPVWIGVLLTGLSTLMLLALQQYGVWLLTIIFLFHGAMCIVNSDEMIVYRWESWSSWLHFLCSRLLYIAPLLKARTKRSPAWSLCSPTQRKRCNWSCNLFAWGYGYAVSSLSLSSHIFIRAFFYIKSYTTVSSPQAQSLPPLSLSSLKKDPTFSYWYQGGL